MIDEETNKIVLDMDNHPVVAYEDIPLVLSSNFRANEEGFLLEAIGRIDPRIERADFLARMVSAFRNPPFYLPRTVMETFEEMLTSSQSSRGSGKQERTGK